MQSLENPQGLYSMWQSQLQESNPIHNATHLSLYYSFPFLPSDSNLLYSQLFSL